MIDGKRGFIPSARLAGFAVVLMFPGCSDEIPMGPGGQAPPEPDSDIKAPALILLESDAFGPDQPIPKQHTRDGKQAENLSPPLKWSNLPDGTKQLALIVDDPDAPLDEPWVHWVLYNIPADAAGLPQGIPADKNPTEEPAGAIQGRNSWDQVGYGGPEPPPGTGVHHYHFKLYALDADLSLGPDLDKFDLLDAIKSHVVGQGELIGTYER